MNPFARSAGTALFTSVLTLAGGIALGLAAQSALAQPSDDWGSSIPKGLILAEPPAGEKTIGEALTTAKVGEAIVLRGRIATSKDAFKEGRAAFTLMQPTPAVAEAGAPDATKSRPGASPAQPEPSASIQIVDDKGRVLRIDIRNKRGLRSGAEIIVVGKVAATDGAKALEVNATGIYILPAALPKDLFLTTEPKGAKPVEEVKKTAKVGDVVAMRGRVGGGKEPFVDGRAVFTLMGTALKACGEGTEMDSCKTPWDYCCETKKAIAEHSATVQIVESDGSPIKAAVKGQNGVKELSDLIVVGKVVQVDGKTMIVSATGLFVARP